MTVADGHGSADFGGRGKLTLICFLVPFSAQFDYDIQDAAGFGIAGRPGVVGNTTVEENKPCVGKNRLTISNADHDGAFSARLYFESEG